MKLTQILSLAALLLGATGTPVGNADVTPTDRPTSLPKEAIPAGALVFGLDGSPEPTQVDVGPVRMAKRDDCKGSGVCFFLVDWNPCKRATNAYIDNAWYCGYTSRVSFNCTAIFTCGNFNGGCWAGWFLKQRFEEIKCYRPCGSRYFDNGNCRATHNYCVNCQNVG